MLSRHRVTLSLTTTFYLLPFLGSQNWVTMSAPVTISGNEARVAGGAIWVEGTGTVTLPVDADISGNTATVVSQAAHACT